ncbi:MAG: DUF2520 domain-containing protein [Flavobacteriales bacterium]
MSWKIGLIGTGNVASFWAKNLSKFDNVALFVKGNSPEAFTAFSEKFMVHPLEKQRVDCLLICVQDRHIDHVLQSVDPETPCFIGAGLYSLTSSNHNASGILYPLQTIQAHAVPSFEEVPFLVELPSSAREIGHKFIAEFKLSCTETTEEARFAAHIAAVFINNFGYHVMKNGLAISNSHGLPIDLFKPIINRTTSNLFVNSDLQTGPARRNDVNTIEKHQSLLNSEARNLYDFISNSIMKTYGHEL